MESYEAIAEKLKLLKGKGVRIALDDFGKGYSSLNYLKQLPISTLKIDKSFVDTISADDKNKSLTDLIVTIGITMGLCVVAEGVETQEQLDYLVEHKCSKIQGYFFSRPVPDEAVIDAIKERKAI
jgi:EAL domain-containing protein (putative c-di-GMP-specific phosphodiesterase class I)